MRYKVRPAIDRFEEKFSKSEGCWLWTAALDDKGYGAFGYEGKVQKAHRVSVQLYNGVELSSDEHVCHTCDTPACVNPEHLFVGTRSDNMKDMVSKGRQSPGLRKLLLTDIPEVSRLIATGMTQKEVGEVMNCHQSAISRLLRR